VEEEQRQSGLEADTACGKLGIDLGLAGPSNAAAAAAAAAVAAAAAADEGAPLRQKRKYVRKKGVNAADAAGELCFLIIGRDIDSQAQLQSFPHAQQ
jgi:hypothetical protein